MTLLKNLINTQNKEGLQKDKLVNQAALILAKELRLRVAGKDLKPEIRMFLNGDELLESIRSCILFTLKDEKLSDGDLHCSDLKDFVHHKSNSYTSLCEKLAEGSLHQFATTLSYDAEMLQCLFTLYGDIISSKDKNVNNV